MCKTNYFTIGQPVCISNFCTLPLIKISQAENTMIYDEKRYLVGRILGTQDNIILSNVPSKKLLVITVCGFVISVDRDDLNSEPASKMDAFLKEQEYLQLSQRILPYDGKLVKNEHDNWCIQL